MNKYVTVEEFLADLTIERKQQVEALRKIILSTGHDLTEHIKWNSPSYIFNDEDRITFNMHYPDQTMILLHMGATRKEDKKGTPVIKDTTGLITWNSDIRGTLSFKSIGDIEASRQNILHLINEWLAIS